VSDMLQLVALKQQKATDLIHSVAIGVSARQAKAYRTLENSKVSSNGPIA